MCLSRILDNGVTAHRIKQRHMHKMLLLEQDFPFAEPEPVPLACSCNTKAAGFELQQVSSWFRWRDLKPIQSDKGQTEVLRAMSWPPARCRPSGEVGPAARRIGEGPARSRAGRTGRKGARWRYLLLANSACRCHCSIYLHSCLRLF